MGLEQLERRLERLVEGAFARVARTGLQPVEIGRRLAREMDLQRTIGVSGLIAPNVFDLLLSSDDWERLSGLGSALANELAAAVRDHAREEGYLLVGPVTVAIDKDDTLTPGVFLVASRIEAGPDGGPEVILGLPGGQRVSVGREPMVIGRLPDCDVVLPDTNVSRRHARIYRDGTDVVVEDLGSTNGTKVNGVRVARKVLSPGDRILLGRSTLVVEMP